MFNLYKYILILNCLFYVFYLFIFIYVRKSYLENVLLLVINVTVIVACMHILKLQSSKVTVYLK